MDDVVWIDGAPLVTTAIAGGTGTAIGNMTGNGGLAAGFDGTTAQAQAASAGETGGTGDATIGKDWGAGNDKIITRLRLWQPTNGAVNGASGNLTVTLDGSANGSAWTTLYSNSAWADANGGTLDVPAASITTTTAYRYHRVHLTFTPANLYLAEVEFSEDV